MEAEVLYVEDIAKKLGTSTESVRMSLYRGNLPAPFRIGRRLVWRRDEFDAWLARKAKTASGVGG